MNLVILASGSGTNAENIIRYFTRSERIKIVAVYTNRPDAGVIERCRPLSIPCRIFSAEDLRNGKLERMLFEDKTDVIILAGFLLKIPSSIVQSFPNRIINIHPALLPKYGGKGMYGSKVHEAVMNNGDKESGITIHLVNENYDEGRQIFQASVPIELTDTPENLARKIHELEYRHFPAQIEKYVLSLT